MKTKTYGRAYISFHRPASFLTARGLYEQTPPNVESVLIQALLPIKALRDYKINKEHDTAETQVAKFFSIGFDTLKIRTATNKPGALLGEKYWPDNLGRYWWSLTSNEGDKIESFYWTKDLARGWPDKKNKDCYWFIIHNALTDFKTDGFCYQADKTGAFPDKKGNYRYFVEYADRSNSTQTAFFQTNLSYQPKPGYDQPLVKRRLFQPNV